MEDLSRVLDNLFGVGPFRVGLDSLIGLAPGAGDWVTAVVGSAIIVSGVWQGLPKVTLLRMLLYLAADLILGAVPVVGDLFDFAFQSNRMNLALYREALAGERKLHRDWWFVGIVFGLLALLMVVPVLVVIQMWGFLTQFP